MGDSSWQQERRSAEDSQLLARCVLDFVYVTPPASKSEGAFNGRQRCTVAGMWYGDAGAEVPLVLYFTDKVGARTTHFLVRIDFAELAKLS